MRWQRLVVDGAGHLVARGRTHRGGRTVIAPAPLEQIPIYARAHRGSVGDR